MKFYSLIVVLIAIAIGSMSTPAKAQLPPMPAIDPMPLPIYAPIGPVRPAFRAYAPIRRAIYWAGRPRGYIQFYGQVGVCPHPRR